MGAVDCAYFIEGQGPTLLMVHGIGSRHTVWEGLVEQLESDFQCISYDLRGHGESPIPSTPFTLDDLVADVEALRGKLGIESLHIIGHSLGGMIGPAYAKAHPERVRSLGLLSTAAGRTPEDRERICAMISAMEEKGIGRVVETSIGRWFTDDFVANRPDAIEARLRQVVDTPADVFMNVFRIYAETEMGPWLDQITAPALVLTGELDGGCNPRLNRFIADALPNAELVVLDALKHAILIEASDRVAAHVRDFLLRHR
jgi:pimeloyl-ACP methyl ester carboxylesterase